MEGQQGRGKRTIVPRGGVKVKSALDELAELRKTGGKRVDRFEVREEEAVYDVVDDAEYAKLVQKRREEGGERPLLPQAYLRRR
jgi:DNA polymerase alpha subunit A